MTSLRSLTIMFVAAFAVATALTGYWTFSASRNAVVASVDRRIEEVGDAMLSGTTPGDAAQILARIDTFSRLREHGDIGFELEDRSGRRLGGNVTLTRAIPFGLSSLHPVDQIPGLSAGRVEMRDAGGGLRLITIVETEPIDGYAPVRMRNYALGFGSIALIVLAGVVSFGAIVRRRIAEVRNTAEAIIDGDLQRRVPVGRDAGMFADQAITFNRMLDRIETLMLNMRNISSDVAHDLRTPLTRLHGRLSAMAARPRPGEDEHDLNAALAACDALLRMFAAVLRISEVEGGDRRQQFATFDIGAVVQGVCDALGEAASESGHRLSGGPFVATSMHGDRQLLSQALFNLVENALRHTPSGSVITLGVARSADQVMLSVGDDGPGIADVDRATALRRFGRLERSRHDPGHGLGLPLVDAIARLHGGTLTLSDGAPGLVAILRLPARDAKN